MKNGDRIRSMTDEELNKFFDVLIENPCVVCSYYGKDCNLCAIGRNEWLKQESEA